MRGWWLRARWVFFLAFWGFGGACRLPPNFLRTSPSSMHSQIQDTYFFDSHAYLDDDSPRTTTSQLVVVRQTLLQGGFYHHPGQRENLVSFYDN
jgi:hypothetical protein